MAFPTMFEVLVLSVLFAVGVLIVYSLSKALKIHPKPITIVEPRKEAALAIIVSVALIVLVTPFWILTDMFQIEPPNFIVDVRFVLWIAFIEGIIFLTAIAAMKSTRQKLGTIGINNNDPGRMAVLGLIPSVIYLIVSGLLAPSIGGGFTGFSSSLAYALILVTIVGFCEEAAWRGYIQTRLSAYAGAIKGVVITSLLFALWHFPYVYYRATSGASGDILASLAWALLRVFPSMLFGYMMLKSQNIIPSSIFHLLYDLSVYLWRIS